MTKRMSDDEVDAAKRRYVAAVGELFDAMNALLVEGIESGFTAYDDLQIGIDRRAKSVVSDIWFKESWNK